MYYRVNIECPWPRKQNEALIKYVEILKSQGLIHCGKIYDRNVCHHNYYEDPIFPSGFFHNFFWFNDKAIAQKFINDWDALAIKRETYSPSMHETMRNLFTEIIEVDNFDYVGFQ